MCSLSAKAPLLRLPTELHLEIISHLHRPGDPYAALDLTRLRLTNRCFNSLVEPPTLAALLRVESTHFCHRNNLYVCRVCRRLRRAWWFSRVNKSDLRVREGMGQGSRFCKECAAVAISQGYHRYEMCGEHGAPPRAALLCGSQELRQRSPLLQLGLTLLRRSACSAVY
jgi:hypothetical protein